LKIGNLPIWTIILRKLLSDKNIYFGFFF
jgi:hypothetical protein